MSILDPKPYGDLEDINLNYIERIQDQSREPLTTVVGIKSNSGIVLASDSQWTSSIKNYSSKLFGINRWVGLGASGTRPYIRILVKSLEQKLRTDDLTTEEGFRDRVDVILAQLFRERVTNRSTELGYFRVADLFDATALLGARLSSGNYALFRLSLAPPDPVVEIVDDYSAIGTGMSFAHLLLRQQTRAWLTSGQSIANANFDANVWLGALVINEIKTFDKYTSGNTRVAVIDGNGFVEYTRKQLVEKYEAGTNWVVSIAESFGVDREVARSIFPEL